MVVAKIWQNKSISYFPYSFSHNAYQPTNLPFLDFKRNIIDKKRRRVVFRENCDGKFKSGTKNRHTKNFI